MRSFGPPSGPSGPSEFTCECLRCEGEFTVPLPLVFCEECAPIVAEQAANAIEDDWVMLARDYGIMRGDRVRLKTPAEKDFERDVMTDAATL